MHYQDKPVPDENSLLDAAAGAIILALLALAFVGGYWAGAHKTCSNEPRSGHDSAVEIE